MRESLSESFPFSFCKKTRGFEFFLSLLKASSHFSFRSPPSSERQRQFLFVLLLLLRSKWMPPSPGSLLKANRAKSSSRSVSFLF